MNTGEGAVSEDSGTFSEMPTPEDLAGWRLVTIRNSVHDAVGRLPSKDEPACGDFVRLLNGKSGIVVGFLDRSRSDMSVRTGDHGMVTARLEQDVRYLRKRPE